MIKKKLCDLWTTGRGLYVLLGLLFFGIFIAPVLIAHGLVSDILIELIFALILIAGVFATPCSLTSRLGMFLLASLAVSARVLDKYNQSNITIIGIDNIFASLTLIAFTVLIIKNFLLGKTLLRYRIAGAVAVYLIFGVLWARLYEIVYLYDPIAFSSGDKTNPVSLIYFSFVTLITLGYGDIVPISITARSLTILEGVIGQLYIVILISTLVSEFSAVAIISATKDQ